MKTCNQETGKYIPWFDPPPSDLLDDAPILRSPFGSETVEDYIRDEDQNGISDRQRICLESAAGVAWSRPRRPLFVERVICVTCSSRCYCFAKECLKGLFCNPILVRATKTYVPEWEEWTEDLHEQPWDRIGRMGSSDSD